MAQESRLRNFCNGLEEGGRAYAVLQNPAFEPFRTQFERGGFRHPGMLLKAISTHFLELGESKFVASYAEFADAYKVMDGHKQRWNSDISDQTRKSDFFTYRTGDNFPDNISACMAALPFLQQPLGIGGIKPILSKAFFDALLCDSIEQYFAMRIGKLSDKRQDGIDFDGIIRELGRLGFSVELSINGEAVQANITQAVVQQREELGPGIDYSDSILVEVCAGGRGAAR